MTLPAEDADRLRRVAEESDVASVSAYVSAAVRERLGRDAALAELRRLYAELGVCVEEQHHTWARGALGLDDAAPRGNSS